MQVGEYKLKMNHHKITVACMHALLKQIMCCEVPERTCSIISLTTARAYHRCIFRVGAKGIAAAALIQAELIPNAGPDLLQLPA